MRLPALHRAAVDGAGRARRRQGALLELHPAQRKWSRRAAAPAAPRPRAGGDRAGAQRREPDARRADRAVRRDATRGDRGHAPGGRRAAPRARGGHGDLRRQPQRQRLQRLRRRLRVLRLRAGPPLARRLRVRARGVRRAHRRGGRVRRQRDLHAVGHPSRLGAGGLRGLAAAGQADGAAPAPACLLADGGRAHVRRQRPRRGRGLRPAARRGPRLDAGHGGRGAARRRAPAHQPEQAPGRALGADHRGLAPRRPALHGHGHVRPHRGAVGARRAHARRA